MRKIVVVLSAFIAVLTLSCQKDTITQTNSNPFDTETKSTVTEAMTTNNIDGAVIADVDLYTGGFDAGLFNLKSAQISACPKFSFTMTNGGFPIRMVLDYGDSCSFGGHFVRTGKMIIETSGPCSSDTTTRTITFVNFSMNKMKLDGKIVFTNEGRLSGLPKTSYLDSIKISYPDGKWVLNQSLRVRQWTKGFDTLRDRSDDEFTISGSSSMSNSEGKSYSKTITTPLLMKGGCDFIVSGVIQIIKNGATPIIIDYGDGTCDSKATVTKDGVTKEIDLWGVFTEDSTKK
ncbi:MAG: hypothetical protein Q8862_03530 [Bacteroidota bacterium]|nr:hypothetical protein [Bacteroidota bacterium]